MGTAGGQETSEVIARIHPTEMAADAPAAVPEENVCPVCLTDEVDTALLPCEHMLCKKCAPQLRACPLCRSAAPALRDPSGTIRELPRLPRREQRVPPARQRMIHLRLENQHLARRAEENDANSIVTANERCLLITNGVFIWLFIFLGGRYEWLHDIEKDCTYQCRTCSASNGCEVCIDGYLNGGYKCYDALMDLPPVKTAAALGPKTYFGLIIIAQIIGVSMQICLASRLLKRGRLPRAEMWILVTALTIEVSRMVMVDTFMLAEYFAGRTFAIFPAPNNNATYYIATHKEAWDPRGCSTFSADSALLDYDEDNGWGPGGHARFSRVGWVIGGEFAMYYFFATVINEVADNFFVIPYESEYGWQCKWLAVVLEMFQLG